MHERGHNSPPALQVAWYGSTFDPSGYGEVTRRMLWALADRPDLRIRAHHKQFWKQTPLELSPDRRRTLEALAETPLRNDAPTICVQNLPPLHFTPNDADYNIGMLTFETDRLPPEWPAQLNELDEVWTYSQWGADVFREAGVERPITVVPHGVDTDVHRPEGSTIASLDAERRGRFLFGSVFEWSARKNPEALLSAYFNAFDEREPVTLVLKTYYQFAGRDGGPAFVRQQIERLTEKARRAGRRPGRVMLVDHLLEQKDMPAFYRSIDAYVLPARGEGWGLTFSEAMASGCPTIGVGWSANTAYMDDANSLLLRDYRLVTVRDADVRNRKIYVGHRWADCSVEELAAVMRRVYEDSALRERISIQARADMLEKFTWQHAADIAHRRLHKIAVDVTDNRFRPRAPVPQYTGI